MYYPQYYSTPPQHQPQQQQQQQQPPQHHPQQQQQQQPPLHNNRDPHHTYRPGYSSFYRPSPAQNRSSHNLNFSREFERFPTPPHGYSSMPSGAYPFYDSTNQKQRWRTGSTRIPHQYHRTPAFHFQDKSTYYYMSDPIISNDNRITVNSIEIVFLLI